MKIFIYIVSYLIFICQTFSQYSNLQVEVETLIGGGAPFTDDIALDQDGTLYINDAIGVGSLQQPQGKSIIRIVNQTQVDTFSSGFNLPLGNFLDENGNLLIANYLGGSIINIDTNGTKGVVKSGIGNICDVVKDSNGNIFATRSPNQIIKIDTLGNLSILVQGAPLDLVLGLTIDDDDNLYVANFRSGEIHKIYPESPREIEYIGTVGNYNEHGALGFLIYKDGFIYCTGYANAKVYIIDLSTKTTNILAGTGEQGIVDGPGDSAQFTNPNGIAINDLGDTLYISDDVDRTLRVIKINKSLQTNSDFLKNNGFTLKQNYPNPFNPTTTLSYVLESESIVKLNIYNTDGKHILELVDEKKNMGNHEVSWNGLDKFNQSVKSGVYFYNLQVGDFEQTKKMIYIK